MSSKLLLTILGISIFLTVSVSSIFYKIGWNAAHKHGYSKGQVDLILDLQNALDEKVNASTVTDSYTHFVDVKDISVFIYEKNNVKTIAIWE